MFFRRIRVFLSLALVASLLSGSIPEDASPLLILFSAQALSPRALNFKVGSDQTSPPPSIGFQLKSARLFQEAAAHRPWRRKIQRFLALMVVGIEEPLRFLSVDYNQAHERIMTLKHGVIDQTAMRPWARISFRIFLHVLFFPTLLTRRYGNAAMPFWFLWWLPSAALQSSYHLLATIAQAIAPGTMWVAAMAAPTYSVKDLRVGDVINRDGLIWYVRSVERLGKDDDVIYRIGLTGVAPDDDGSGQDSWRVRAQLAQRQADPVSWPAWVVHGPEILALRVRTDERPRFLLLMRGAQSAAEGGPHKWIPLAAIPETVEITDYARRAIVTFVRRIGPGGRSALYRILFQHLQDVHHIVDVERKILSKAGVLKIDRQMGALECPLPYAKYHLDRLNARLLAWLNYHEEVNGLTDTMRVTVEAWIASENDADLASKLHIQKNSAQIRKWKTRQALLTAFACSSKELDRVVEDLRFPDNRLSEDELKEIRHHGLAIFIIRLLRGERAAPKHLGVYRIDAMRAFILEAQTSGQLEKAGIPFTTSTSRLHEGREALKEWLEAYGISEIDVREAIDLLELHSTPALVQFSEGEQRRIAGGSLTDWLEDVFLKIRLLPLEVEIVVRPALVAWIDRGDIAQLAVLTKAFAVWLVGLGPTDIEQGFVALRALYQRPSYASARRHFVELFGVPLVNTRRSEQAVLYAQFEQVGSPTVALQVQDDHVLAVPVQDGERDYRLLISLPNHEGATVNVHYFQTPDRLYYAVYQKGELLARGDYLRLARCYLPAFLALNDKTWKIWADENWSGIPPEAFTTALEGLKRNHKERWEGSEDDSERGFRQAAKQAAALRDEHRRRHTAIPETDEDWMNAVLHAVPLFERLVAIHTCGYGGAAVLTNPQLVDELQRYGIPQGGVRMSENHLSEARTRAFTFLESGRTGLDLLARDAALPKIPSLEAIRAVPSSQWQILRHDYGIGTARLENHAAIAESMDDWRTEMGHRLITRYIKRHKPQAMAAISSGETAIDILARDLKLPRDAIHLFELSRLPFLARRLIAHWYGVNAQRVMHERELLEKLQGENFPLQDVAQIHDRELALARLQATLLWTEHLTSEAPAGRNFKSTEDALTFLLHRRNPPPFSFLERVNLLQEQGALLDRQGNPVDRDAFTSFHYLAVSLDQFFRTKTGREWEMLEAWAPPESPQSVYEAYASLLGRPSPGVSWVGQGRLLRLVHRQIPYNEQEFERCGGALDALQKSFPEAMHNVQTLRAFLNIKPHDEVVSLTPAQFIVLTIRRRPEGLTYYQTALLFAVCGSIFAALIDRVAAQTLFYLNRLGDLPSYIPRGALAHVLRHGNEWLEMLEKKLFFTTPSPTLEDLVVRLFELVDEDQIPRLKNWKPHRVLPNGQIAQGLGFYRFTQVLPLMMATVLLPAFSGRLRSGNQTRMSAA